MALVSTQSTTIMMEVSSSTSSSYHPFYYSSSLFSASPSSFAPIPTRKRLSIGMSARNIYDRNTVKPLKMKKKIKCYPYSSLDSVETAEWGVLPLERFLFLKIKSINSVKIRKIRKLTETLRWKGFSLRVTHCISKKYDPKYAINEGSYGEKIHWN